MDKLRKALSGDADRDERSGIMSQFDDATTLSCTTRLKLFAICFIVGILLSFLGSFALFLTGGISTFAIFYTLGNIVSIMSTCFLMGPMKQIQKMFAPTRVIATLVVIISFLLTLLAVLKFKNPAMALLFIIIQSLALTWYSLSYIPYARELVKKSFESIVV